MLADAYKLTKYKIAGHGPRDISVLKKVFESVDDTYEADTYGNGKAINDFEEKMAKYLGKEAALFFPSGTMAQQIALRIWCDNADSKKVAYHPLSHLEIHEQKGLKEIHGIEGILLGQADRLFTIEDLTHSLDCNPGAVLFELPQREIGGQLPNFEELLEMTDYVTNKGIKCHLDGARLFECLSYYSKDVKEIVALFDSVYLSFYKGIGGIAGAILAGPQEFINEAKIWKRRYGGDLISLYPYSLTADYYFEQRIKKMDHYVELAKEVAEAYSLIPKVKVLPEVPVTNMFHVHWYGEKTEIEDLLEEVARKFDLGLTSYLREVENGHYYYEVSLGDQYDLIPETLIKDAFSHLQEHLK